MFRIVKIEMRSGKLTVVSPPIGNREKAEEMAWSFEQCESERWVRYYAESERKIYDDDHHLSIG